MSDIISTDDFLEHFGVKGMRWGVRNDSSGGGGGRSSGPSARKNPNYDPSDRHADQRNYGGSGVKRINTSINKGATVKEARVRERKLDNAKAKEDGLKSTAAGVGGAVAGYFGAPLAVRAAKSVAWSPVTLKVLGNLTGGAPFPVKLVAANSLVLARTVTSLADSPLTRVGVQYVGGVAAGTAASKITRKITDSRATKEFNRRNPQ